MTYIVSGGALNSTPLLIALQRMNQGLGKAGSGGGGQLTS